MQNNISVVNFCQQWRKIGNSEFAWLCELKTFFIFFRSFAIDDARIKHSSSFLYIIHNIIYFLIFIRYTRRANCCAYSHNTNAVGLCNAEHRSKRATAARRRSPPLHTDRENSFHPPCEGCGWDDAPLCGNTLDLAVPGLLHAYAITSFEAPWPHRWRHTSSAADAASGNSHRQIHPGSISTDCVSPSRSPRPSTPPATWKICIFTIRKSSVARDFRQMAHTTGCRTRFFARKTTTHTRPAPFIVSSGPENSSRRRHRVRTISTKISSGHSTSPYGYCGIGDRVMYR